MTNDARTELFTPPTTCALDPSISLPDYATTTHIEPQPAWRTLNAARERAFTGEIKFCTSPQIVTYVDGGTVYFAERVGDAPLGERLVAAGVVTQQQLERGVVRVGGAEHLGRLFDRDETIDRDAVMVAVEAATDALVSELAAEVVAPIEVGAYRHHPSGVHRWFVAPADTSLARPVSDVAQVDRSVIDELPDLTTARTDVTIEWDHPAPTHDETAAAPAPIGLDRPDPATLELDIEAELGRFNADEAEWSTQTPTPQSAATDDTSWLNDFQIVWPDGTEEPATPTPSQRPSSDAVDSVSLDVPPATLPEPEAPLPSPDVPSAAIEAQPAPLEATPAFSLDTPPVVNGASAPAPVADDADGVRFAMPQIVIDSAPEPDADIPVDVADAVRRALRAIENAAVEPASLRQIDLEPLTLPEITLDSLDEQQSVAPVDVAPVRPVSTVDAPAPAAEHDTTRENTTLEQSASVAGVAPQPATFEAPSPEPVSSFAPPSSDMRAEAIYARAAAEATAPAVHTAPAESAVQPQLAPEPGQASVVFLDDDDDSGRARKGALRRLIGSLRRAD
jgi:hypothetical protein